MNVLLPNPIEVLIDDREKKPLVFPETVRWWGRHGKLTLLRIETRTARLTTGDYAISGFEEASLVERKGSMEELDDNLLGQGWPRFRKCLVRLRDECRAPWIMLDMRRSTGPVLHNWTDMTGRRLARTVPAEEVLDTLLRRCLEFGIRLAWCPPGRDATRAGEETVRLLMSSIAEEARRGR